METKELLRFKYVDDNEASKYTHRLFYSAGLVNLLVIQYVQDLLKFTPREFDRYHISFKLPIDPDLPDELNDMSYLLSLVEEKPGDLKLVVLATDDEMGSLADLMDLLDNSPEKYFTTMMRNLLKVLSDYDKLSFIIRNSTSSIHSIDLETYQVKLNILDFSFVQCEPDELDPALVTEDGRYFDMSTNYPWTISILSGFEFDNTLSTDLLRLRSYSNTLKFVYDEDSNIMRNVHYDRDRKRIARKLLSPRICL